MPSRFLITPPTCPRPDRRHWGLRVLSVGAALVLPGCAAFKQIGVEVVTYGEWPAQRVPGRYAFDRLPSQTTDRPEQVQLEAAAAQALERAGFVAAGGVAKADVLVQLGWGRSQVLSPLAESRSWGGRGSVGIGVGIGMRRGGFGIGGTWGEPQTYDRQQARMLFIDRASRDKLVEIQVQHEARYSSADYLPLLFDAGLSGFPDLKAGTRHVTVQLP